MAGRGGVARSGPAGLGGGALSSGCAHGTARTSGTVCPTSARRVPSLVKSLVLLARCGSLPSEYGSRGLRSGFEQPPALRCGTERPPVLRCGTERPPVHSSPSERHLPDEGDGKVRIVRPQAGRCPQAPRAVANAARAVPFRGVFSCPIPYVNRFDLREEAFSSALRQPRGSGLDRNPPSAPTESRGRATLVP